MGCICGQLGCWDHDPEESEAMTIEESEANSWNPEVIADDSGEWCGNGLFFARKEDAEDWVYNLSLRWTSVRATRVVPSNREPNR